MPDAQNVHVHAHTRDEPVASLDHAVGSLMSLATELASMISGTCTAVSNTSGGSSNSRSGSPRIPLTFDDCDEARTRSQVLLALAQLEQTGIKISMLVEHHRGVDRVDAASVAAAEEDTVRAVALPPSAQSEIVNLLEVYRTRLATIVEALDTVPESRGRLLISKFRETRSDILRFSSEFALILGTHLGLDTSMLQLQWSMHSSSVTLSTFTADIVPQVNARRLRSFVTDNRSFWGYLKTKQSMLEFNNVALFGEKLDEMRAIVDDQVEQIDSYEQEVVEERDDLDGSDEDDMCGTGGILSADERAVNQTCKTLVETIGKLLKKVKHRIVDETIDKENPSHIIFLDTLWYDHIRKLMESGDELVDALDAPHDMLFITAETRRFTEIAVDVAGRCKELALPKHHVWFDMCVKRMLSLLTAVQDHAPER